MGQVLKGWDIGVAIAAWCAAFGALVTGVPEAWVTAGVMVGVAPALYHRARGVWGNTPVSAASPAALPGPTAEEDAEERHARASFLAKVSHELRTPLHNVLGLLRILYVNDKNTTHKYYLNLIQEASNTLLGTINDVLDFSKANTGMLTTESIPMRLDEVVRHALRTVAPRAFDKQDLELVCTWGHEVPVDVVSDPNRLRQILVNLLGNAVKFTTTGYVRLQVRAESCGEGRSILRFGVSDTGIGIPESQLASIFEPFNQVDMTVVRRVQGTGLGLTIVRQLVTLLGGEVGVESAYKQGSTFWFTVPVKTLPPVNQAMENSSQEEPFSISGKRIYLLGNAPHLVEILRSDLCKRGSEVIASPEPLNALQMMKFAPNYLIVLDDALASEAGWRMIEDFAYDHGATSVVVLLSPASLRFRERASQMELPNILALPVVTKDIVGALAGTYREQRDDNSIFDTISSKQPLNILIADDIPTNQLILRTALEEAGHKVRAVNDGEALYHLIQRQVEQAGSIEPWELFDVVLTDIQMPKLDGISVIKKVRSLEAHYSGQPLPMIAVTAHAFDAEREKIFAAGANGIVTKPLSPKDLERQLEPIERRSVQKETLPSKEALTAGRSSTSSASPVVIKDGDEGYQSAIDADFHPFVRSIQRILLAECAEDRGVTIDINDVFTRSGESPRRTLLMLRSFVGCYGDILLSLQQHEAAKNPEEIGKAAHALKGLVAEAGATEIKDLAYTLEKLGKEGDLETALPLLPSIVARTEELASVIKRIVSSFDKDGGALVTCSYKEQPSA